MTKLTKADKLQHAALHQLKDKRQCERDLRKFMTHAWNVVNPGTPLLSNWHIDLICEYLTGVYEGDIRRLIINIPPRMGKSTLCSQMFPTWVWANKPETRWIFHSHNQDLATQDSVARRNIIESDWYQTNWADKYQLSTDQNVKTEFQNTSMGKMVAHGNTGKGGDFLIVDDPHSAKQAESDVQRQAAIDFFKGTLRSRLDNLKTGRIVVIMQRLHEDDLAGQLLARKLSDEHGVNYEHLNIPIITEKPQTYLFPVSKTLITRTTGELMMEDRIGKKELSELKIDMGSYRFNGQYMQRPAPPEGHMIKRAWFNFYTEATKPKKFERIIQSWDCTFKDSDGSDYVVGQVWGSVAANKYLLHQVRERLTLPDTIKRILTTTVAYPDSKEIFIEDKANGPAVIQSLKDHIDGLIAVNPEGSKEARVSAVSPSVEARNIYVPDPALHPWVEDFLGEITAFPKAAYDDTVDAFTQAVLQLNKRHGMFEYYEQMYKEQEAKKAEVAQKQVEAGEELRKKPGTYGQVLVT